MRHYDLGRWVVVKTDAALAGLERPRSVPVRLEPSAGDLPLPGDVPRLHDWEGLLADREVVLEDSARLRIAADYLEGGQLDEAARRLKDLVQDGTIVAGSGLLCRDAALLELRHADALMEKDVAEGRVYALARAREYAPTKPKSAGWFYHLAANRALREARGLREGDPAGAVRRLREALPADEPETASAREFLRGTLVAWLTEDAERAFREDPIGRLYAALALLAAAAEHAPAETVRELRERAGQMVLHAAYEHLTRGEAPQALAVLDAPAGRLDQVRDEVAAAALRKEAQVRLMRTKVGEAASGGDWVAALESARRALAQCPQNAQDTRLAELEAVCRREAMPPAARTTWAEARQADAEGRHEDAEALYATALRGGLSEFYTLDSERRLWEVRSALADKYTSVGVEAELSGDHPRAVDAYATAGRYDPRRAGSEPRGAILTLTLLGAGGRPGRPIFLTRAMDIEPVAAPEAFRLEVLYRGEEEGYLYVYRLDCSDGLAPRVWQVVPDEFNATELAFRLEAGAEIVLPRDAGWGLESYPYRRVPGRSLLVAAVLPRAQPAHALRDRLARCEGLEEAKEAVRIRLAAEARFLGGVVLQW
ncbi:MAG: hypothetical protein HY722_06150 [Planctomycetes bacterium]|nr:hypothetical protein [Planctomycetota bacterium]